MPRIFEKNRNRYLLITFPFIASFPILFVCVRCVCARGIETFRVETSVRTGREVVQIVFADKALFSVVAARPVPKQHDVTAAAAFIRYLGWRSALMTHFPAEIESAISDGLPKSPRKSRTNFPSSLAFYQSYLYRTNWSTSISIHSFALRLYSK